MSWTYTHKPKSVSIKDFFKTQFSSDMENITMVVQDCAVVNLRTAYLSVKSIDKKTQRTCIYACVFYLDYRRNEYSNFGFNGFDEMGNPSEANAPKRILEQLSETDNECALQWRARCWENIQKSQKCLRLRKGMIIRHKTRALNFQDNVKRRYFEVIKRGYYRSLIDNKLCRFQSSVLREMEICNRKVAEADLGIKPAIPLQSERF